MAFTSARWANPEKSAIEAVRADGSRVFVPADPANADFQQIDPAAIAAYYAGWTGPQWVDGKGNVFTARDHTGRVRTLQQSDALQFLLEAGLSEIGDPSLDVVKRDACAQIDVWRDARVYAPIDHEIEVDDGAGGVTRQTLTFDADERSQNNIHATVTRALLLATTGVDIAADEVAKVSWILNDNRTVAATSGPADDCLFLADIVAVGEAIRLRAASLYTRARAYKDRINACMAGDDVADELEDILTEIEASES